MVSSLFALPKKGWALFGFNKTNAWLNNESMGRNGVCL